MAFEILNNLQYLTMVNFTFPIKMKNGNDILKLNLDLIVLKFLLKF